ncbi:MAG: hypothetical protein ACRD1K_20720 [Acidimicrobiales bacterium]
MSYVTVETRVQSLLQGITGTFPVAASVSRGDYRVLDSGEASLAVLTPGNFDEGRVGQGGAQIVEREWHVLIDLFRKYLDDGTSWQNFAADRDAVLQELERRPTLNSLDGIVGVALSADSDPGEVFDENDNGPFFIWQRIRIQTMERADVTGGEYG